MSSVETQTSERTVDPWTQRPVVGKFRVLDGVHSEGAIPGTYRLDGAGAPMSQPRVYLTGEVVASRSDLEKHNPIYGVKKFARVDDSVPDKYDAMERELAKGENVSGPAKVVEDLESMTVAQLRQAAEAEEIELDDTMRKQEIINWIRQSRGGVE